MRLRGRHTRHSKSSVTARGDFWMDNREMAHGHQWASWPAGAWAAGAAPPRTAGHNATSPRKALPRFTTSYLPRATRHHRVTLHSCFPDGSAPSREKFSTSAGSQPTGGPHRGTDPCSGHAVTLPVPRAVASPETCGRGDMGASHTLNWEGGVLLTARPTQALWELQSSHRPGPSRLKWGRMVQVTR